MSAAQPATATDAREQTHAPDRVAVSAVFAVHGAVFGTWATRVPWVQDHVSASAGQLGIALLMPGLGSILAMPVAGSLLHRWSGRAATRALIVVFALMLALPALCPTLPVLCVSLLLFGASAGISDITMNAQAVRTEQRTGRAIMSSFHGLWSVGGLLASGVGVVAAHGGVDARLHLALMAALLVVVGAAVGSRVSLNPPEPATPEEAARPKIALPPRPVLLIGLIGFCAVFAEGVSADWCAVYLRDVADAGPGIAASAFSAFAATMAAARLLGDRAVRAYGPVRSVRIGGTAGVLGAAAVALAGTLDAAAAPVAIAGFALLGMGIAVVVPLAFTAAGQGPSPERAIAGVATIAYGAGLAAPGLVGAIAQAASLPVAFALVTALVAVVAFGAPALRPGRMAFAPQRQGT